MLLLPQFTDGELETAFQQEKQQRLARRDSECLGGGQAGNRGSGGGRRRPLSSAVVRRLYRPRNPVRQRREARVLFELQLTHSPPRCCAVRSAVLFTLL